MSLFCPLSMNKPTLYGMKLANNIKLGSPVCVKLHDSVMTRQRFLTLKWHKVTDYSTNIKLDISPPLKKAIGRLAASRFRSSAGSHPFYTYIT